jgi:hypothetical protein
VLFLLQPLLQGTSSSSSEAKSLAPADLASTSAEELIQIKPSLPPIESESDLKFIWIEPNVEDYYEDFHDAIRPASDSQCSASVLISQIPNRWIGKRIFLCMTAREAGDLLPKIYHKPELYRVYILCQNKAEEDQFRKDNNEFEKIRISTNNRQVFIRQVALDIVPTFIEIGDISFEENAYQDARRWYEAALQKVNDYGDLEKKFLLPTIKKKLSQC